MKPSLQASSAHDSAAGWGGKKLLDHVLGYPDVYIGSVEKRTTLWVDERGTIMHCTVTDVPVLHKIFDDILVNAADNKQRTLTMDENFDEILVNAADNKQQRTPTVDALRVEIEQKGLPPGGRSARAGGADAADGGVGL